MSDSPYSIDGLPVPRVTSILDKTIRDEHLEGWRMKLGNEEATRQARVGANLGHMIHKTIESWSGLEVDLHDEVFEVREDVERETKVSVDDAANSYMEWERENVSELIEIEIPVLSRRWRYGGRADRVVRGRKTGKIILLDLKTSKRISDKFYLQMAAYRIADHSPCGFDISTIQNSVVVHLDRKTLVWHSILMEREGADEAFLAARTLYRWKYSE